MNVIFGTEVGRPFGTCCVLDANPALKRRAILRSSLRDASPDCAIRPAEFLGIPGRFTEPTLSSAETVSNGGFISVMILNPNLTHIDRPCLRRSMNW